MDVFLENGASIQLVVPALGSGGEGDVYRVQSSLPQLPTQVAKLYKPAKRTSEQANKIRYLIANPPQVTDGGNHTYLIWPRQLLFDAQGFCGFLMNRASGEELEKLCLPTLDSKLGPEWQPYAHGLPNAHRFRLHAARNLCHAVDALQRIQSYVLGDFKPANVFITSQSLTAVIDVDSVQVAPTNANIQFISNLCTPEYTPPEGISTPTTLRKSSWDNFSLAVSLYRLLTGIHPFAGSYTDPAVTSITDAMGTELYAHGPRKAKFAVCPPPHKRLHEYPAEIADLFGRCFNEGMQAPHLRPTSGEWYKALHRLLDEPPVLDWLTPGHDFVTDAATLRLSWQVQNAHTLTLSTVGNVTNLTEALVTVRADTVFTLEATSFGGHKVSKSLTIKTDQRPPNITAFTATAKAISVGDALALNWQVSRTAKLSIFPDVGNVTGRTTAPAQPNTAGRLRYTLRAESAFGIVSEETVEVEVFLKPKLTNFVPRNGKIKAGQATELTWKSQHCATLTLTHGNTQHDVTGQSSFEVQPATDTTYHLLAEGHGGLQTVRAKTKVQVFQSAQVDFFKPDRPFTIQTVPTTLRWRVQHYKSLRLEGPDLPAGGQQVSGKDHHEVTPNSSAEYTLFVGHELDGEQPVKTRVEVQPLPRFEGLTLPPMPALRVAAPPALPDLMTLARVPDSVQVPLHALIPDVAAPAAPLTGWLARLRHTITPPSFTVQLGPDVPTHS